jgi:hypothetical protein
MMSQLLTDLKAVDALLSDESKWCKGALARSQHGWPVLPSSPSANRWSLLGAIERVCEKDYQRESEVRCMLIKIFGPCDISYINDDYRTDFAAIKKLFANAIQQAVLDVSTDA